MSAASTAKSLAGFVDALREDEEERRKLLAQFYSELKSNGLGEDEAAALQHAVSRAVEGVPSGATAQSLGGGTAVKGALKTEKRSNA